MGTRHFECRTFDLSDNSPYISSVILAPEECKKNTQERYEIVKSEPAQSLVRRTFSADETAGASKNFESISLRPLRYVCLFGFTACYMGNMVCALLHLTHNHIAHYSIPNLSPFVNQNSRCFCVGVGSKGESSWWRRMKTWRVFSVMDRPLCLGTV